jgi:hypothetical protein
MVAAAGALVQSISSQGALAKDAAHYKPRGGSVDVFLWKRDPAARREPPPRKTEAQVLEELFPGSQDPLALGDDAQTGHDTNSANHAAAADSGGAATAATSNHLQHQPRRRRRGELAM